MAMESYWDWFTDTLKAEYRAFGGETCRVCSEPIDSKAAWQHRDRHVCSTRCNQTLIRRMKAKVKRGEIEGFRPPEVHREAIRQERDREPRLFRTLIDAEFPYEHGRFPIVGDVVERHGQHAVYVAFSDLPWLPWQLEAVMQDGTPTPEEQVLGVLHVESGYWTVHFVNDGGEPSALSMGSLYSPVAGSELPVGQGDMPVAGTGLFVGCEFISDVGPDGREFRWEAGVFSAAPIQMLWTPERMRLSQKRTRVTRAKNSYQARMRALGVIDADARDVDPQEIYERDRWVCQICGKPVDRSASWPDPYVATLDHVRAVTRGGGHSEENLQTAHWLCNVVKGNRP